MARKKAKKKLWTKVDYANKARRLGDQNDRLAVKLEESQDATRMVIEQRDELEEKRDELQKRNDEQVADVEKNRNQVQKLFAENAELLGKVRKTEQQRHLSASDASERLSKLEKSDAMIGRLVRQLAEVTDTVVLHDGRSRARS